MSGSLSFFSKIKPGVYKQLLSRVNNTNKPNKLGGVSGLSTWVRITSAAKKVDGKGAGGLVIDTYDGLSSFEKRYGNYERPGIIGYELDLKTPVTTEDTGRGLRPRPVLTSLSVEEFTEGTRSVSFDITCFTKEQVDTISQYFLEVRFNLLIEWGWNNAKSRGQLAGSNGVITACDLLQYKRWPYIAEKRAKSDYQYDASLVTIKGGNVTLGENETFNLKVECVGLGETAQYLQTQRSSVNLNNDDGDTNNGVHFVPDEIEKLVEAEQIGAALFAQMFNDLPKSKRTTEVQNLINDLQWSDQANFVNMDEVIRKDLMRQLSSGKDLVVKDGSKIKVPDGATLFSNNRFIRFGLAVEILNTVQQDLKPQTTSCGNNESIDLTINIDNTIICAFPHMFSANGNILFIPNTTAPNFNIKKALSDAEIEDPLIDFKNLDDKERISNLHLPTSRVSNFTQDESDNGASTPYAFPSTYRLTKDKFPVDNIDDSFIPFDNTPAGHWGWLKNLYVNFDYFISVISKPNYIIRDVFYELLNGMSSSVNSIWNFQIVEKPNLKDGSFTITVVDKNFTGVVNTEFDEDEPVLEIRGLKSPFLSFETSVEISTALTTSAIMDNRTSNYKMNTEQNDPKVELLLGTFFSDNVQDQLGTELLKLQKLTQGSTTKTGGSEDTGSDKDEKKRNLLFEIFKGKAQIYPTILNRESDRDITKGFFDLWSRNDTPIENALMVGSISDPDLLRQIQMIDEGFHKKIPSKSLSPEERKKLNLPFGVTTVNFSVHGIGGFKIGDRIKFKGLPKKLETNLLYRISKIDHKLQDNQWITDVEAKSMYYSGDEQ